MRAECMDVLLQHTIKTQRNDFSLLVAVPGFDVDIQDGDSVKNFNISIIKNENGITKL